MGDYDEPTIAEAAREVLLDDGEKDVAGWVSEDEGGTDYIQSLLPPVPYDDSFPNTIFIYNLPKVGEAKFAKLLNVVEKTLNKFGENTMEMPYNEQEGEEKKTYGAVIVTFKEAESAKKCLEQLDDVKLDKVHSYKVLPMQKYKEMVDRPDSLEARPAAARLKRSTFRTWLNDDKCREQMLLRYQGETEIYWHDPMAGGPVLYYGGENQKAGGKVWCDWHVHWSPQGSFLATHHKQGIALWAGPQFDKQHRLPQLDVQEVDFSPNEEFVLLWNGDAAGQDPKQSVKVFHVLTGRCVWESRTPQLPPKEGSIFPYHLWSHDGKYLAEMTDSRILVRDTETWELVPGPDGKPAAFKFPNLKTFQWSPKDNIIAVWTKEADNNPARLSLVEIPSRKEIASKSRTQCQAEMYWQSEGEYLCLQVTKLTKTGKRISTNMEILRVTEKQVPVDVVVIEEVVKGFFWESKGRRFAVLTADEQGHKPRLLLYALGTEKTEQVYAFDLPSASYNEVSWAPEGQYFIVYAKSVAGGASSSGDLIFAGLTPENKLEILHKDEHYMITDVQWDPSSRFVITAVTQPISNDSGGYKYSMEAGYAVWTFQGRSLFRQQKEKLYHVSWRPHPPSLIPPQQQLDIRKNLKQYSKKYDALDEKAKDAAKQAFRKERDEKIRNFKEVLDRLSVYKEEKEEETGWRDAEDEFHASQDWKQDEEIVEEIVETTEDLISTG